MKSYQCREGSRWRNGKIMAKKAVRARCRGGDEASVLSSSIIVSSSSLVLSGAAGKMTENHRRRRHAKPAIGDRRQGDGGAEGRPAPLPVAPISGALEVAPEKVKLYGARGFGAWRRRATVVSGHQAAKGLAGPLSKAREDIQALNDVAVCRACRPEAATGGAGIHGFCNAPLPATSHIPLFHKAQQRVSYQEKPV